MTDPDIPLSGAYTAWWAEVERTLNGAGCDTLVSRSDDDLPIGPLYPAGRALPVWRDTRQPCHVVQHVDHPDLTIANGLALDDLDGGASGLALVLAGAPAAQGFGVEIADATDATSLLAGIRLDAITVRFEVATVTPPLAWDAVTGLVDPGSCASSIDFGLDPIGVMAHAGGMPQAWGSLARSTAQAVATIRQKGFVSPVLRADGRPHHAAGATDAQELAAVLATGVAYLRAIEDDGPSLEDARMALSFTLSVDADEFLSLTKLRAMRRLWASLETACGLTPRPIALHAETATRMLTRRDPWTNLLRNGLACSAALLGGADSVSVLPHTSALGLPDGFARRLARTMPLVLMQEADLGRVDDPAAGSGAFEALTDQLSHDAWRLFQTIEQEGGMVAALASGAWQERIETARQQRQSDLMAGTRCVVGTTAFTTADETPVAVLPVSRRDRIDPLPIEATRFVPLTARRETAFFDQQGGAQ
ncbi:methylmalonyl-CoA mutase family protein [Lichenihabitans psoromatis]|uniref:methylmalonyl-CoA mutase family protein n=1 Tax=Lichenihabitans psoromatis TaxID=2528642 RepID=UPI0010385736|nr:methylmalonyl-CoA mutase family protein [Lichenihabitans psoromatis]